MAELFMQTLTSKKNIQTKPMFVHRKECFQVEIRRREKQQKKKQLRQISHSDGPDIKSMVCALPGSFYEVSEFLQSQPQFNESISKLIIDLIYAPQFCSQSLDRYYLLPGQEPSNEAQLKSQLYFFMVLLQNQGRYAPQILKRYFSFLTKHAGALKMTNLLYNLLQVVVSQVHLNWAPFEEIQTLISTLESQIITNEEIEIYFHLAKNYFPLVEANQCIKNKIKNILNKGSQSLSSIKPKLFYKLCLVLTYSEGVDHHEHCQNQGTRIKDELFFHEQMIKGSFMKNLLRQVFYSSNLKLRILCLKILQNLIIEFESSFMWTQQKISPIELFQAQIKDKSNSMQTFNAYSKTLLISILKLPLSKVSCVLESQIQIFELILYILENNTDRKSHIGQSLKQLVHECLFLFLEYGNKQFKTKIANKLLESRWKNLLDPDSPLIQECIQTVNSQF